jgi:1,4-alpha-glucan branching enzyme
VSENGSRQLVCVSNLSPVVREGWRLGLPAPGKWVEVLNTDSRFYGGSDVGNGLGLESEAVEWHGQPDSAEITLPPLATVWFVPET